jgi:LysR family hydrogen peroxide-inducible transcriptional activator
MENLTIKQLRYFQSVAQHGHFGRAAEACSVSQPAISVQIRELEQTLGQKLFERHARYIHLTAFGEEFSRRTREILRSIDDLSELARASHGGLVGKLRLGIIPTLGPYLLPRVVSDLSRGFPGIDLRIRETQTENLIADLHNRQLDAALVALPISEPDFTEIPLFKEPFVLLRPLADAAKPVPDWKSLSKMRLLLLEEGHCFRDQALAFCGVPSSQPRESMEGSSLSTLVQMVASGLGVTLIPEMAVPLETRSADVSVARLAAPEPNRTIGMVWRRASPLSPHMNRVAEMTMQSFEATRKDP